MDKGMRIGIFGDNYVKRLGRFTKYDMKVPAEVRFFGQGGMNAEKFSNELMENILQFKPHFVFVTIGGNDISHGSSPKEIAKRILEIVDLLLSKGVTAVYFSEIAERKKFLKDPKLTKKSFDAQRKKINKMIEKTNLVRTFKVSTGMSTDYEQDQVHYNDKGNRKYFYAIRRIIFTLKI